MVGFVDQARHQSGLLLYDDQYQPVPCAFQPAAHTFTASGRGWIVILILERLRGRFSPEQKAPRKWSASF